MEMLAQALDAMYQKLNYRDPRAVTLRNANQKHEAAAILAAGIDTGAFVNGPTAMLMSGDAVHEYRLIALIEDWTLVRVHATKVKEGSLDITVKGEAAAALAIRLKDFAQDADRDEEWTDNLRLSMLIADMTWDHTIPEDVTLYTLWHNMDQGSDRRETERAAAKTLAQAVKKGDPEPFNRSTGGSRAYQISFMELQADIWLATARRLRPVLAKAKLEADQEPSAQYILTVPAKNKASTQPAAEA